VTTSGTATAVVRHARGLLRMPNSVHAPALKSLRSVSETTRQYDVLFQAQRAYNLRQKSAPPDCDVIAKTTQTSGMYHLDTEPVTSTANARNSASTLYDWNLRLGHPSDGVLRQAIR
jgi:hypothetical protein